MSFGEKVAELRRKNNMTQDELGKVMNVSYQAVSKWERDESQPDFETISKIAKLFKVPLSYFEEGAPQTYAETAATVAMPAAPAQKTLVGTCTECGKVVYEGEAGELNPKLLCRACHAQREEAHRQRQAEREAGAREYDRDVLKVKRRGFIWGAIAAVAVFIIIAAVNLSDKAFFKENLIVCLALSFLLPILAFAGVSRLRWLIGEMEEDEIQYKVSTSMIVGALFAAGNVALTSVYYCSVDFIDSTTFAACLVAFALLSFIFISQYLWGGIARGICFAGGLVLKMPGIIFTLNVGGIITFILIRILFGIIVMLVFFISVLVCETAAIVFSVFSFAPSLIRRLKTQKYDL